MRIIKNFTKKILPLLLVAIASVLPMYGKAQDLSLGLEYAGSTGLGSSDLRSIVVSGIQIVLGLIGLILLVLVIYAGYLIMTAAGDQDKIKKGKQIITSGLIGLVIIFSAYAIVTFVFGRLAEVTGSGGNSTGNGGDPITGSGVNFQPSKIYPEGQLAIRNVVVNVRFNKAVKPESVNPNSVKIKKDNGDGTFTNVPVSIELADNNRLVVKPTTLCSNSTTSYCFDYDATNNLKNKHVISVAFNTNDAVIDINGKKLNCLPASRCEGEFIVGANVDLDGPKTNISQLKNTLEPFEIKIANPNAAVSVGGAFIVDAVAQDKGGVDVVNFYEKINNDYIPFGSDVAGGLTSYFVAKSGPPGLWQTTDYAIDSQHTLVAVATDNAGNVSTSSEAIITIRPRHCFNGQLDGVGDPDVGAAPDQPETAIDCGGICGACAGQSCKTDVNAEQCVPNNNACSTSVCDTQSCLCVVNPEITEISPDNGAPGNWVTIIGKNFGKNVGTIKMNEQLVSVVDYPGCSATNNWQDGFVIVEVPKVSTGEKNIILNTSGGLVSNSKQFIVNDIKRPGICALDKLQYEVGQNFKITGQQFGSTADARDVILGKIDNGISAENQNYQIAQVDAKVPNVQPGKMGVSVIVNNQASNSLPISVKIAADNQLKILSISPLTGAAGQYVTIIGQGFGAVKGESQVLFGGDVPAEFDFPKQCGTNYWSNNQIVAKVPAGVPENNLNEVIKIKVSNQSASSIDKFVVNNSLPLSPGLCSINPNSGEVGGEFEIAGDNLKDTSLKFKNASQGISITTSNGGKYSVPPDSQTGNVTAVNVNNPALISNPLSFEVKKSAPIINGTSAYYQWQFKTCADCYRPKVVVNRQCTVGEMASPTPLDGSVDNFVDSSLAVTFDRLMDQNSLNGDGILNLENCGGGDQINLGSCAPSQEATLSAVVNGGQINEPSTVVINKSDYLRGATWYRITISNKAKSVDGVALGGSFSWSFKTRADSGFCTVDKLSCTPTSLSLPFGNTTSVYAHAYNLASCNVCPDVSNWSWSAINKSVVVAPSITNSASVTGVESDNSSGVKAENSLYASLPAGMCKIKVVAPAPKLVIDNKCTNNIQSPSPFVDSTKICPNALIGVRFTVPMKPETLSAPNVITVQKEKDVTVPVNFDHYIVDEQGQEIGAVYVPSNALEANKKYNVILDTNILQSKSGQLLDQSSLNNWSFTTGDNSNCQIKDVIVNPAKKSVVIGDNTLYNALTVGNNCQLINPPADNWSWRSTNTNVATVSSSQSPKTFADAIGAGLTYIKAKYANKENQDTNGLLMSSATALDSSFRITKVEPLGNNVCTNALVRITFNRPVNKETVRAGKNNATIKMAKIAGQNSQTIYPTIVFGSNNSTVTLEVDGNLSSLSKYSISLIGGDLGVASFDGKKITSAGCNLPGLRWLSQNNNEGSCAWDFNTSEDLCEAKVIDINPNSALLSVDDSQNWEASAYAVDGTLLNDKANWSIIDEAVMSLIGPSVPAYSVTSTALMVGRTQIKATVGAIEKTANTEVVEKLSGPLLSEVQPLSPPPACLNSLIKAKFDAPLNVVSIQNNAKVVYQGVGCNAVQNDKLAPVTWLPQSSFNKTFYSLLSAATKYLGGEILDSITNLIAHKVLADNPWCDVEGAWQVDAGSNAQEISFTQSKALPANATIRVVFTGGANGLLGANGLPAKITQGIAPLTNFSATEFGWQFVTSNSICKVAYVDVYGDKILNKKDWTFNRADNDVSDDYPSCVANVCDTKTDSDKVFTAVARSADGSSLTSIDNVYSWNWSWNSSDLTIAGIGLVEKPVGTILTDKQLVMAENKNGNSNISATAIFSSSANQSPVTGAAKATVFMCNNPWPTMSGQWQPITDSKFNFSFFYCRDSGAVGEQDDLPELNKPGYLNKFIRPVAPVAGGRSLPICHDADVRQFCLAKSYTNVSDVVVANTGMAECAIYTGSPVWTITNRDKTIDSLKCSTGNIYIDYAAGKVGDNDLMRQYLLEVPGTNGDAIALRLYENNYQNNATDWYKYNVSNPGTPKEISSSASTYPVIQDNRSTYIAFANQDDPVTTTNKARAYTLVTSYNQDATEKTINIANQILKNIRFNTNIQSDEQKSKLVRDFKRVGDLQSLAASLFKYYLTAGSVPALSGGTFVSAMTLSNWPSWQQTLATALKISLPNDPVNEFGSCSDCVNTNNYKTDFENTDDLTVFQSMNASVSRVCAGAVTAQQGSCYASVMINSGSDGDGIGRNINLSADTTYKLTAKVYMTSTTPDVLVQLQNGSGQVGKNYELSHSTEDAWKEVSFEVKTTASELFGMRFLSNTTNYTKFLVDDIKVDAVAGHCADFDPATCWNPKANNGAGEFACSKNSYGYLYKYNKSEPKPALQGKLYALTELVSNWLDDSGGINTNLDSKVNLLPPTGNLPVCTSASAGNSCGDGVVISPEICELGDSQPFCDAGKTWYNPAVSLCESSGANACKQWQSPTATICNGKTSAQCCGGYCGDGVLNKKPTYRINIDEQCDASVVSGDKGYGAGSSATNQYACSQTCHDVGGYCGDSTVESQYGEQCDGTTGLSQWTCSNGSAPSCNGCRVTCGGGATPYRGSCGNNVIENNEQCDYCGNGYQSIPGQGECTGASITAQYFCTNQGVGQCQWTGGYCGDNITQDTGNLVNGRVMEYCDRATNYSSTPKVNKCSDNCQGYICQTGFFDCDAQSSNGCEIESAKGLWVEKNTINPTTPPDIYAPTQNDINNKELIDCGGCAGNGGVTCAWVANSAPMCTNGQCKLNCLAGYVDENGAYEDGCEKIGSKIVGKVNNTMNMALDDATIMLFSDASNNKSLLDTTTSNASGDYTFTGLEKGKYKIVAFKRGYYSVKNPLVITTGGVTTKDFSLAQGDKSISGFVQKKDSSGSVVGYAGLPVTLWYQPEADQQFIIYGSPVNSAGNGAYSFTNLEKNGIFKITVAKPANTDYYDNEVAIGALTESINDKNIFMNRCGDGVVAAGHEICDGSSSVYSCSDLYGINNLLQGPTNYSAFQSRNWDGPVYCNNSCNEIDFAGLEKNNNGNYTLTGMPGGDIKYNLKLSKMQGSVCSYGPPISNSENYRLVKTPDIATSDSTQFIPASAPNSLNGKDCWFRARSFCASDQPVWQGPVPDKSYYEGVYYIPSDNETVWHKGKIVITDTPQTPTSGGVYCQENNGFYTYSSGLCASSNANNCNWTLSGKIYSSRLCWIKN